MNDPKKDSICNHFDSIGIAEAPQHGESMNEILREADLALYSAKETGRDRVVVAPSDSEKNSSNEEL